MLAALADVECRYSSARRRLSSSSVEPLRRESKIIGRFARGEGGQACAEVENAREGKPDWEGEGWLLRGGKGGGRQNDAGKKKREREQRIEQLCHQGREKEKRKRIDLSKKKKKSVKNLAKKRRAEGSSSSVTDNVRQS